MRILLATLAVVLSGCSVLYSKSKALETSSSSSGASTASSGAASSAGASSGSTSESTASAGSSTSTAASSGSTTGSTSTAGTSSSSGAATATATAASSASSSTTGSSSSSTTSTGTTTSGSSGGGQLTIDQFPSFSTKALVDVVAESSGSFLVLNASDNEVDRLFVDGGLSTVLTGFQGANALARDAQGNLWVADQGSEQIILFNIDSTQIITTVGDGIPGLQDGPLASAEFSGPSSLAIDRWGNLVVADTSNNCVRYIDLDAGQVSTLAGAPDGGSGMLDGPGRQALFDGPEAVAVDDAEVVYVADVLNSRVRRVQQDAGGWYVDTFAGNGIDARADGPAPNAEFGQAFGIAVDGLSNVYVSDIDNDALRLISGGYVSTLASGPPIHAPRAMHFDGPRSFVVANTFDASVLRVTLP